jgi:O-antigen/teichoic acid export membrane protein
VYYIAVTLAMIPLELMNKIASNVLYPLYSQLIRDNHFSKNESIQNAREVMLCFMFNITALLLAGSGVFFNTLYKVSFESAIELMPALCLLIWFMMLTGTLDRILLATGHVKELATLNLSAFVLKLLFSVVGYHYFGLHGFLLGGAIGGCLTYLFLLLKVRHFTKICLTTEFKYSLSIICLCFIILYYQSHTYVNSIVVMFGVTFYSLFITYLISPHLFNKAKGWLFNMFKTLAKNAFQKRI